MKPKSRRPRSRETIAQKTIPETEGTCRQTIVLHVLIVRSNLATSSEDFEAKVQVLLDEQQPGQIDRLEVPKFLTVSLCKLDKIVNFEYNIITKNPYLCR